MVALVVELEGMVQEDYIVEVEALFVIIIMLYYVFLIMLQLLLYFLLLLVLVQLFCILRLLDLRLIVESI